MVQVWQATDTQLNRQVALKIRPAQGPRMTYPTRLGIGLAALVSRRYEHRPLVITTNLPFKHWDTIFPNASCAVALIDRLTHHAEILAIEGESYRKREAELSQATEDQTETAVTAGDTRSELRTMTGLGL